MGKEPNFFDADAECINLATRRRNGQAVRTPVWFIMLNGVLYLRTARRFGKVKRIQNDPAVDFAPCNWDGDLSGEWRTGRASLLAEDDPMLPELDAAMDRKYGERRREMTAMMASSGEALVYIKIESNDLCRA